MEEDFCVSFTFHFQNKDTWPSKLEEIINQMPSPEAYT